MKSHPKPLPVSLIVSVLSILSCSPVAPTNAETETIVVPPTKEIVDLFPLAVGRTFTYKVKQTVWDQTPYRLVRTLDSGIVTYVIKQLVAQAGGQRHWLIEETKVLYHWYRNAQDPPLENVNTVRDERSLIEELSGKHELYMLSLVWSFPIAVLEDFGEDVSIYRYADSARIRVDTTYYNSHLFIDAVFEPDVGLTSFRLNTREAFTCRSCILERTATAELVR